LWHVCVVYEMLPAGGWALCAVCSNAVTIFVCLIMLLGGECV